MGIGKLNFCFKIIMAMTKKIEETETKKKEYFKGLTEAELKQMSIADFAQLLPSAPKRHFKRGVADGYKELIRKSVKSLKTKAENEEPKMVKTHFRDAIIIPCMLGCVFGVYNGREYIKVEADMGKLGCHLWWFSP